jgi:Tfp pilus assembly protein PilF
MMHSRDCRQRRFGLESSRFLCAGLTLFAVIIVVGCVSEERIQKSSGHYQEGLSFLTSDPQKAFVSFQKATQENPNNKEAHYALGHLYATQGKLRESEREFREALRVKSDYSEAHTYLGHVLVLQQRWDEGIKAYRRALENPQYVTPDVAQFHLGKALVHQGDLQGARKAYEDALLVYPLSVPPAQVHLELGQVYHKLGLDAQAREVLAKAVELDRDGQFTKEAKDLMTRLKP